jgi:hypothetical protein
LLLWFGRAECHASVNGISKAQYKSFESLEEAQAYLGPDITSVAGHAVKDDEKQTQHKEEEWPWPEAVYTDGSCRHVDKVRRAGIGVWFGEKDPRNISEALPGHPTNQRAEIYVCSFTSSRWLFGLISLGCYTCTGDCSQRCSMQYTHR